MKHSEHSLRVLLNSIPLQRGSGFPPNTLAPPAKKKSGWEWTGLVKSEPAPDRTGYLNLTLVFLDESHFLACVHLLDRFKKTPGGFTR